MVEGGIRFVGKDRLTRRSRDRFGPHGYEVERARGKGHPHPASYSRQRPVGRVRGEAHSTTPTKGESPQVAVARSGRLIYPKYRRIRVFGHHWRRHRGIVYLTRARPGFPFIGLCYRVEMTSPPATMEGPICWDTGSCRSAPRTILHTRPVVPWGTNFAAENPLITGLQGQSSRSGKNHRQSQPVVPQLSPSWPPGAPRGRA